MLNTLNAPPKLNTFIHSTTAEAQRACSTEARLHPAARATARYKDTVACAEQFFSQARRDTKATAGIAPQVIAQMPIRRSPGGFPAKRFWSMAFVSNWRGGALSSDPFFSPDSDIASPVLRSEKDHSELNS